MTTDVGTNYKIVNTLRMQHVFLFVLDDHTNLKPRFCGCHCSNAGIMSLVCKAVGVCMSGSGRHVKNCKKNSNGN